jgi:single-strand DNA-binding protein
MINKCFLFGLLTTDPELKYLPTGTAICDFSIALNSQYKNSNGEMIKEVSFIQITAMGKQAETYAEHLHKGSPVMVQGKLKQERWETQDGQKRSKIKILAELVQFMGSKDVDEKSDIPF